MKLFVDASAIVAILTKEADFMALWRVLRSADDAMTSPVAIYEATLAVRRKVPGSVAQTEADVRTFLAGQRIREVAVTPEMSAVAIAAHARYGKGQGHPAQLNMGDCFAYAAAKVLGSPLLFKGEDFVHTDITVAV